MCRNTIVLLGKKKWASLNLPVSIGVPEMLRCSKSKRPMAGRRAVCASLRLTQGPYRLFLMLVLSIAALSSCASFAFGAEFYAAPNGSASGDGSINRPWNLATALGQPAAVHPGDTIWLRGGRYVGRFYSSLTGTAAAPIKVRQYPGERATIDGFSPSASGNILQVGGAYTWYWGFEIMSSDPYRVSTSSSTSPPDIRRGGGVYTDQAPGHPGLKFINLVVHDAAVGFGWWQDATDSEIYGCLIYYNGWKRADGQGAGHGINTQNSTSVKHV